MILEGVPHHIGYHDIKMNSPNSLPSPTSPDVLIRSQDALDKWSSRDEVPVMLAHDDTSSSRDIM